MKHVHKSVLLWYSPREMYALVTAFQDYPKFLPWCDCAEVLETYPDGVKARVHIAFAGIKQAFTTRNVNDPGRSVRMTLVDGPFSQLEGHWLFSPLNASASAADAPVQSATDSVDAPACKIEFSLSYAFSNRPLALVISPVFDRIAHTFVEAFVQRAEQVYGPR